MNSNKAPGPDGLSVEFYVKFWDRLGLYLCRVPHVCYRAGEMCESMKRSNTRVIFKKGDRKDLKTSNLHILRDVLDHIDRTNETSILISLDQEKAFDRVNRTFLLNLLSRFGFGPSFCFWINTLYNGGAQGLCYKVGVYADDTTCIVKSYRSLQCLFRMIIVYEGGSGARLNVTKTEPCGWEHGILAATSRLASNG